MRTPPSMATASKQGETEVQDNLGAGDLSDSKSAATTVKGEAEEEWPTPVIAKKEKVKPNKKDTPPVRVRK